MKNSLQKQKSELSINEGKHIRLNPSDTPILSKCVSYAKQYSTLNKRCLRNLINVWKTLPQNEREEYFHIDAVSKNVSYFCEGSRVHTPSPKKSRQRKQDEHTVSLHNLRRKNEQLNQISIEFSKEFSKKQTLIRSSGLKERSIGNLSDRRSTTPEISSFKIKRRNKEMEVRFHELSTRSQTPIVKSMNTESSWSNLKNATQSEGIVHPRSGMYYKSPGRLVAMKNSSIHSQNIAKAASKIAQELAAKEVELLDSKVRVSRTQLTYTAEGLNKNSRVQTSEVASCINIHGILNCRCDKIELELVNTDKSYEYDLYITCLKGANDLSLLRKNNIGAIFYIGDDENLSRYPGIKGGYNCIPFMLTPDSNLLKWIPVFDKFLDTNLNKHNVLIACYDGTNRSCSVCLGYIMSKYSIAMAVAYSVLYSARPFVKINDYFTKQLQAYEKQILRFQAFLDGL